MPPLDILPDIEALLSTFLAAQPEIQGIAGDRIYTALPNDPGPEPMLRITRYGGSARTSAPLWIDRPQVQLDGYGGPKATAHDLLATAMAVLAARVRGEHDEGIVTGIIFGQMRWLPDEAFTNPRPRYIVTSTLTTHPIPSGVGSI